MKTINKRTPKTTQLVANFSGGYVDYYDDRSIQENIASELKNVNCKRPPNLTTTLLRDRIKTFTTEYIQCIGKYQEKYLIFIYVDSLDLFKTKLGYMDPDVLTLVEIGVLETALGSYPNYYQFATFNEFLYVGYNENFYKWDGNVTFTQVTTIPGEWDVNLLSVNGYRMYASKVGESSLFFSDNGNDDFTDVDGSGIIPVESSKGLGIRGMTSYADSILVFTAGSMHKLIGSGPDDYWFKEISSTIGCVDNESIVEVKGYLYFRSWDGIYVYDGSNIPTKIDTPIENTIDEVSQTVTSEDTKAYRDNVSMVMYYGKYGIEYDTLLGKWYRRNSEHLPDDGDVLGFISLDNETYSIVTDENTATTNYLSKEDEVTTISEFVDINSISNPNFSDLSVWDVYHCTLSVLANILTVVSDISATLFNFFQDTPDNLTGETWFLYSKFKSISGQLKSARMYFNGVGYIGDTASKYDPVIGTTYELYKKQILYSDDSPGFFMLDFGKENQLDAAEVEVYGDPGIYAINMKDLDIVGFSEKEMLTIVQAGVTSIEQMQNSYDWVSGEYDYFDKFKQVYLNAVKVALESFTGKIKVSIIKLDETEVIIYEKDSYAVAGGLLYFDEVTNFDEEIKISPSNGVMRDPFKIKISGLGSADFKKVLLLARLSAKSYMR